MIITDTDKLIAGFQKAGAILAKGPFKPLTLEGWICSDAAEVMRGKTFAFVPVMGGGAIGLGLAIANEAGYNPVPLNWCNAERYDDMAEFAEALNLEVLELDRKTAATIVCSTMARNARRVGTLAGTKPPRHMGEA